MSEQSGGEEGRVQGTSDLPSGESQGRAAGERFDKFTDRARKVLSLSREEAARFNHNYIGTEHLLLGLLAEGEGVAARALRNLGVELNKVREAVEYIIGRGGRPITGEIGLTPRAKTVIELAVDEAKGLKHHYIGTEHLLLGLVREGEGIAARVLESLGVTLEQTRVEVIRILVSGGHPVPSGGAKSNVVTCRIDDHDLDAIDALVEAGIRSTRSDAAAWLIHTGIETNKPLFDRVYATVSEIHRLRAQAQDMVHQLAIDEQAASGEEPDERGGAQGASDQTAD